MLTRLSQSHCLLVIETFLTLGSHQITKSERKSLSAVNLSSDKSPQNSLSQTVLDLTPNELKRSTFCSHPTQPFWLSSLISIPWAIKFARPCSKEQQIDPLLVAEQGSVKSTSTEEWSVSLTQISMNAALHNWYLLSKQEKGVHTNTSVFRRKNHCRLSMPPKVECIVDKKHWMT